MIRLRQCLLSYRLRTPRLGMPRLGMPRLGMPRLGRLLRDRRGGAAMEFAIIAPILVVCLGPVVI